MPSARRRRFSVQNEIANRVKTKFQNETQISQLDNDLEVKHSQNVLRDHNNVKSRNKIYPNTSKKFSMLEIVAECKSNTSTATVLENNIIKTDKETSASSSNIDLFIILNSTDPLTVNKSKENNGDDNQLQRKLDAGHVRTDRTPRRDRHSHRIQVRSPKRKVAAAEKNIVIKNSIGIDAVDWCDEHKKKEGIELQIMKQVTDVGENTEGEERDSSQSIGDMCRICHSGETLSTELGCLISPCSCRGTVGRVHVKCLERWLTESGKCRCELCGTKYVTTRVHKFGVLRALAMWVLSNSSKHMVVDFFGIMLMTPIALVAAGLTGRTFAGLMAQDQQLTSWPLASTFVLACMTLVCYYCWIVSALTRHALGWWIWYRSHYEVRLQLQEDGEQIPPY